MKSRTFNWSGLIGLPRQFNVISRTLLCSLAFAVSTLAGHAATYTWDVRSGLLPNQVDETMRLENTAAPRVPVLTTDYLLLQTDGESKDMWFTQEGAALLFPTQLVIEAEVKCGANTPHLPGYNGSTAVGIGFLTAPYVGNLLFIDTNRIFFWLDDLGHSPGPTVNIQISDGFHRFRIEVDTPTEPSTQVRVFFDGAQVLTGKIQQICRCVSGAETPAIYFGDFSSGPWGAGYWRYFSHNAAARTPGTRLTIQPAVEICWWAETNKTYQAQWMPRLGTNAWTDFGLPIPGDDSIKSIFDSTRGQPQKIYRIVTLP